MLTISGHKSHLNSNTTIAYACKSEYFAGQCLSFHHKTANIVYSKRPFLESVYTHFLLAHQGQANRDEWRAKQRRELLSNEKHFYWNWIEEWNEGKHGIRALHLRRTKINGLGRLCEHWKRCQTPNEQHYFAVFLSSLSCSGHRLKWIITLFALLSFHAHSIVRIHENSTP